MAAEKVQEENQLRAPLRQFPSAVASGRVSLHREVLENLVKVINDTKDSLPEAVVKGMLKLLLPASLYRHDQLASHRASDALIAALVNNSPDTTLSMVSNWLLQQFRKFPTNSITPATATWGLRGTKWISNALISRSVTTETLKTAIEALGFCCLLACGDKRSTLHKVYKKVRLLLNKKSLLLPQFYSIISKSDPSVSMLCLVSVLARAIGRDKFDDRWLTMAMEFYSKAVLAAKTTPCDCVVDLCRCFIVYVSREQFELNLLPTVRKALLRNPEIVIAAFGQMLAQLNVEMSPFSMELLKLIGAQLLSSDPSVSASSVDCVSSLSHQCSDENVVGQMLEYLVAVLGGSEGKLSTADQRISVLRALGALAAHTVSGANNVQQLSAAAVKHFTKLLKGETNENLTRATLESLSQWSCRFKDEIPKELNDLFVDGLSTKRPTSTIKLSYLKCINNTYHTNVLSSCSVLKPHLKSVLENGLKQTTHNQLVYEALTASVVLLKLHRVETNKGISNLLTDTWANVLEKELFTRDKFIHTLDMEGLVLLCDFIERLLLDRPCDLPVDSYPVNLCRPLLLGLVCGEHGVRKKVAAAIKRLTVIEGTKISCHLMQQFSQTMTGDQWLVKSLNEISSSQRTEETEEDTEKISGKLLVKALRILCKFDTEIEREDIFGLCLDALLPCSVPAVVEHDEMLWPKLVKMLTTDDEAFYKSHSKYLCQRIGSCDDVEVSCSAVRSLMQLHLVNVGGTLSEDCLNWICKCVFDVPVARLNNITLEEVDIMNTPEGTLFDASVISDDSETQRIANLKRESKLYSYKDQLADIKIREEIEEKKRREGKLKPKELTPKQKEAMATQLKKESLIRETLAQLHKTHGRSLLLLDSALASNPVLCRCCTSVLIRAVVPLLKSPLVSSEALQCWLSAKRMAFEHLSDCDLMADLVAYNTARLTGSIAKIPTQWTQENMVTQAVRLMNLLWDRVKDSYADADLTNGVGEEENDEEPDTSEPLPLYSFSYCYPFLKTILADRPTLFGKQSNKLSATALDFIEMHLTSPVDEPSELLSLPLDSLACLLIDLLSNSNAELQQSAADCILALGQLVSEHWLIAKLDLSSVIGALLRSLLNKDQIVREYVLKMLLEMKSCLKDYSNSVEIGPQIVKSLWLVKHDPAEECQTMASNLWDEAALEVDADVCMSLMENVVSPDQFVRVAAASAIADVLKNNREHIESVLEQLAVIYQDKAQVKPPVLDEMGRVIHEHSDQWEARGGVALSLRAICGLLPKDLVTRYFELLCPDAVNDRNAQVRQLMLQAAVDGVKEHGEEHLNTLLPMFEEMLGAVPEEGAYDALRQALVVLLGSLAQHLNPDDPKIRPIVARLIETLSTPSQQVQEAVAQCLPPLVPSIREQANELSANLLSLLLDATNYGERRGAAYGIAGMVKGLGIVSLRELQIMATLKEAMAEKKNPRHREGALLALEMLCTMLGRLFEPYVVQILPSLLLSFGDPDQHVRKAADDCARAVMQQLSAHGVKLVLPALLAALEEDSWRTKCGSVELLGAMAFCAPKQLSSCLPNIVPKLIAVLSDTHAKVQKAGEQALKHIGQVIRNPEIQAISSQLLEALEDPAHKTSSCLQTLIKTKFVHYIDAPSLALIMPVLKRAFDDRSTETRRVSCQIIANIYALTDQKDVEPYLDELLPGLQKSLMDPVPDIRGMAARALGTMVGSASGQVGAKLRETLLPWLKEQLVAKNNPVDRSGAAQGLSEVLGSLGENQLGHVMPDVIETAASETVEPHVRHGYILMYIYLPSVFGEKFKPYLAQVVPSVLKALADESEFVRDTALRAGQRLISIYCETAIPLLLPQLERGLFDNNWRIRFSSVQLLGDFLYRITGVTGKMTTEGDEDDTFGTESASKAVTRVLGMETRNRVLAGLYIARSDVALQVRQASAHVWKVVVSNTPRTLKEILGTLFSLLLGCLASNSQDKQTVAARCLGELVKKMGERILVDVVPVLEEGLKSSEADQRQGVCIALREIFANTTKDMVVLYVDNLIPTISLALYDPLPQVRQAAADTFCVFHSTIGSKALDDVLIPLLEQLTNPELFERTLDGLQQVMAKKSNVVLPYLVPKLTKPPINTVALSQLASVAGDVLSKHLSKILDALLLAAAEQTDSTEEADLCLQVLLSVNNDDGMTTALDLLFNRAMQAEDANMQIVAAELLAKFSQQTKVCLKNYTDRVMQGSLLLYGSSEIKVAQGGIDCFGALVKSMDQREHLDSVYLLRNSLSRTISKLPHDTKILTGFSVPKGLQAVIVILREGVLSGSAEQKEAASEILADLIRLSESTALKPHVVSITGPLIRVLGDRYPPSVKISILKTLAILLEKVSVMLKPFLPQLQSTFLKALQEPTSKSVRLNAARALSKLIVIHPKPDTIFADLTKNAQNAEDPAIRETFLVTIGGVAEAVGDKLSGVAQCVEMLTEQLDDPDDTCRVAVGAALGAVLARTGHDTQLIENVLLNSDPSVAWLQRHGQCVALQKALKLDSAKIIEAVGLEKINKALVSYIAADRMALCSSALRASGFLLRHQVQTGGFSAADRTLLNPVVRSINHQSNDIKTLAADVVHELAKAGQGTDFDLAFLKICIPMMVNGTKEKNSAVRCASEAALVALLDLRASDANYKKYLENVDVGPRESLSEVYSKSLAKLAKQAETVSVQLDDTLSV